MLQFLAVIVFWVMPAQAEEVLVRVYVDDRNERRLLEPLVINENRKTPLRKTNTKDVWLGQVFVTRSDKVTLSVETGGVLQRPVDVSFSDLEAGECTLKMTADSVVMEKGATQGAPPIEILSIKANPLGGVKPSKGNTQRLLIKLDDSMSPNLTSPTVRIQRPGYSIQPLMDNGKSLDDTPNDRVYVAWVEVPAQKRVRLALADNGYAIGALNVDLPSGVDSVISFEHNSGQLSAEKGQTTIKSAATAEEGPSKTDQIAVTLTVDDRILQLLDSPEIQFEANRRAPLRDDGLLGDAEAGDRLFLAQFSVSRDEYMAISIWDGGNKKGALSVFLPSSNTASIRLRTTDDDAGLKLLSEPQSQSQIDSPGAASTDVGSDRLAHVLWVAIILFSVGLAVRRQDMASRWEKEVAPLVDQLEARLKRSDEKEQS